MVAIVDAFHGRGHGSEDAWAEYAWSTLAKLGLTDYDDEVGRTLVFCRLHVLAALNVEFAVRTGSGGYEGDWEHEMWDVMGEYPRLWDPIALGRLAERENVWSDDEPEDGHDLVRELVSHLWKPVVGALLEELGENELFASLWTASGSGVTYPTPDELAWRTLNEDGEVKQEAWAWISGGMTL